MKKFVIFVVLLALAAVAVWYVRPAYRAKKEQRFAAQARMQLTNGEPRKALLSARQTLTLNSNNVTACQVMADLADMGRSPGAIMWRRRLAELQPTLENKAILAACALRYEKPPFPVTAEVLKEMESASKDFTPFHLVSAQMALKLNRRAEAEKHFEESIRLEPTNVLHRLNLAVVRLQSSDANTSAAARAVLEGFQSDASWGAHALRSLAALELGKRAYREARDYSSQILQKPQVTFADKLQHLAILHHAKDAGFDSFRQTLQGQAQTNALLVHELAGHLVNLGRPAEALAWIKGLPAPIQNEQPVPLAISACYSAQKNWRGLEDYLNGQKWTEQEFIRLALLAHAVRSQGEAEVARAHWNRALQVASEAPGVARHSGANGQRLGLERGNGRRALARGQRFSAGALGAGFVAQHVCKAAKRARTLQRLRDAARTTNPRMPSRKTTSPRSVFCSAPTPPRRTNWPSAFMKSTRRITGSFRLTPTRCTCRAKQRKG
jgi:tetratricopeptide (TPR) repeat protein